MGITPVWQPNLGWVNSKLLIEKERNKSSKSSTASLVAMNHHQGTKLKCHLCQKASHLSKQCVFREEGEKIFIKKWSKCTNYRRKGHTIQECWFMKNKEKRKENNLKKEDTASSSETDA